MSGPVTSTPSFSAADPGAELARRLRCACEAHDPTIAGHLDRVTHYAVELARLAGRTGEELRRLELATPLHDLGKIGIPPEILHNTGRFTPTEMELMRTHVHIGHRLLDGSPWPVVQCAAQIALRHHEAWDGKGYPDGLRSDAIPWEARVVSIADVFDALHSARCYKGAWEIGRVVDEMRIQRGRRFDPALLDLFLEHHDEILASGPPAETAARR